jgi:cyclopentanol dehydrogenase
MKLKNKIALVTGAARGIGKEIADTYSKEGATVFVTDTTIKVRKNIDNTTKKNAGRVHYRYLDVTNEEQWQNIVKEIHSKYNRLDILVNNAGISTRYILEECPIEAWNNVLNVNLTGVFLAIKHSIPLFRKTGGGCIINISSVAGLVGHKTSSLAYMASKGAVTALTKGVAVQYAKDNIRVNSINPITVQTKLIEDLLKDPSIKKERIDEIPLKRIAKTTDVANAALFLASDEAEFITGISLPIDGGYTAY